jgi:hypothetical protein
MRNLNDPTATPPPMMVMAPRNDYMADTPPPVVMVPKPEIKLTPDQLNAAASAAYTEKLLVGYRKEMAAAKAKYEASLPDVPTKNDTSPIQSYYIPAEGYYVAYTPQYGVLMVSEKYPELVQRLQHNNHARTNAEKDNDAFNNLSEVEFIEIRAKKPKYSILTKAYNAGMLSGMGNYNGILKRMDLPRAKVIL